jgi:hypothetical protein
MRHSIEEALTESNSCKYVDSDEANHCSIFDFLVTRIENAEKSKKAPQEGGKKEADALVGGRRW